MRMRELEQRTGVNRETIRVYFRKGLLPEPIRPKPNVAVYDETHVRAIRAIRELQHGRRIPLDAIRAALAGDASALPGGAGAYVHLERLVAQRVAGSDALTPVAALAESNPHILTDVRALAGVGAVTLVQRDDGLWLSHTDAQVTGLWKAMREAGFSEANGFTPEVVAIYVDAARDLARHEVETFLSIIAGRLGEDKAAQMAETALKLMLDVFGLLRMKAVLAEIASQTGGAVQP